MISKLKTSKSAKKRFKYKKSGSFKYKHSNMKHLLLKKTKKRKKIKKNLY